MGGAALRISQVLMLAVISIALVGCGGAPPATGAAPGQATNANGGATGTQADLEQAALDSFAAFLGADDQDYFDMLTRDCRERLGFAAVESYLIGRRQRAQGIGGIDLSGVAVSDVTIEEFTGATAEVSLALTGTSEPFREGEPQEWLYEAGAWRLADCSDIRESPNDFTDRGTDRSQPLTRGEIAEIGGWFVSLSQVDQDFEATLSEGEVEPAADGNQLVSAQLLVGYNGAEPRVVIGEHMSFAMVAESTVFGDDVACVSNEYDDLFYDPTTEATPGEDLPRPLICREVPSSVAGSLLLRLTHTPTGTEYWFDLTQS